MAKPPPRKPAPKAKTPARKRAARKPAASKPAAREPAARKPQPRPEPSPEPVVAAEPEAFVDPAPVGTVMRLPQPLPPMHGLATASIACSLAGMTLVPILGGLAGSAFGAAALSALRREPGRWRGHGLAMAGFVLGMVTGVVPAMMLTLAASSRLRPGLFVVAASYAAGVTVVALRGASARDKLKITGGTILGILAVLAAVIVLAFLASFLLTAMFDAIGHAIGDAFSGMFDAIGDIGSGCAKAIDF